MSAGKAAEEYRKYYADINFERAGLFELIKREHGCATALYPGCSIHITPSFYFQHVVYIDLSEKAKEFFSQTASIRELVEGNKVYRQQPFIQFLNSDYTKALPLRVDSYDLLISLYAPEITENCKKYVRKGGLILTNNHLRDAAGAAGDPGIELLALIRKKGKKYESRKPAEGDFKAASGHETLTGNVRKTNTGIEYCDTELYYLLRKL